MDRAALRVAGRWGFRAASKGWSPTIPAELLARLATRKAFALTEQEQEQFHLAKDSIYSLMPSLIGLLRKRLGSRYGMSASQRGGSLFVYFTEPHPIDSITVHLQVKRGQVIIDMGYIPMISGTDKLDFKRSHEVVGSVDDPELAGLTLMRLARKLLDKVL